MEPSLPLLSPDLVRRVAALLPPNAVALHLRLTCRALAQVLAEPCHTTITLYQPVCPEAFAARWGPPGATQRLTLRQRYHLLRLTAASGVVQNFDLLYPQPSFQPLHAGWYFSDPVLPADKASELRTSGEACLEAAAAAGRAEMCRWLLQLEPFTYAWRAVLKAALAGHTEVLAELHRSSHPDAWACGGTVEDAFYELFLWRGWELEMALKTAGQRGNEAIVSLLLQRGSPAAYQRPLLEPLVARVVAEGCSLGFLQHVLTACYGCRNGEGEAEAASGLGAMSRAWMEVLGSSRVGLEAAMQGAAASNRPDWKDRVEWVLLQEQRQLQVVPVQQQLSACVAAARCADAEARLRWLAGRGFPVASSQAACEAVAHGRTEAVVYLLDELGAELEREAGAEAMRQAACRGHLPVLQAVYERGYDMNSSAAEEAVREGHVQVVEWVLGVLPGPAWLHLTPAAFIQAVQWEDWPMLQLLLRVRCPQPRKWDLAEQVEPTKETVEWLVYHHCAYNTVSSCTLELCLAYWYAPCVVGLTPVQAVVH